MKKYAFWNNKGGVGKTFLCFVIASEFAKRNPKTITVVIDMCPQANISEILLGGNELGSENLNALLSLEDRKSVGGYFDKRLSSPDSKTGNEAGYAVKVSEYAENLPSNLLLVPGDSSLELQVQSINQLASVDLPESRWKNVHSWLIDLQDGISSKYNGQVAFFIDCNPSFATYTGQALLASNRLIIPCTADGSSARAFNNIAILMYGHKMPTRYAATNFKAKADANNMEMPNIHLIMFNRYTMSKNVPASAFRAMYQAIKSRAESLKNALGLFTPDIVTYQNVPDAHSVAIIASSKAILLGNITANKRYTLQKGKAEAKTEPLERYKKAIEEIMPLI